MNLDGSLTVTNDQGGIVSSGTILVASATFSAPNGAFVQSYVDSLQNFGDAPYTLWSQVALKSRTPGALPNSLQFYIDAAKAANNTHGSSWIFGDDVSISARYLNINGTIQSGLPDQQVTIDPTDVGHTGRTVTQQIAAAELAAQQYRPLRSSNLHTGTASAAGIEANYTWTLFKLDTGGSDNIEVWYNTELDRIEVNPVTVKGGRLELYGEILSTGNGDLRVLDGFGRVSIVNNTSYDTVVWPILNGVEGPNGEGIEGFLKITDLGKTNAAFAIGTGPLVGGVRQVTGGDINRTALITEYTRVGHDLQLVTYRDPD